MDIITIYTDGGSRGNPGPSAYGFVIKKNEEFLVKKGKTIGITTNNVAEYNGVIEALKWVISHRELIGKFSGIHVSMDSLLLCQQLKRIYRVKQPHLQLLMAKIRELEKEIGVPITYAHVFREKNKEADLQVNLALDGGSTLE